MKILIGFIAVLCLVIGIPTISYINAHNSGNRLEAQVKAQYTDMQNILGQYSLKVSESVQVTEMYKDDFKDVVIGQMAGRYGSDGSQATFQWLKEHNINMDASLYKKVQQIIEAGRNKYENSQSKFIDTKRVYETQIGSFWRGTFLRFAGYPKLDLSKYNIIQSQHSIDTFESGVDTGMKLR